jgi:hypothetical protein
MRGATYVRLIPWTLRSGSEQLPPCLWSLVRLSSESFLVKLYKDDILPFSVISITRFISAVAEKCLKKPSGNFPRLSYPLHETDLSPKTYTVTSYETKIILSFCGATVKLEDFLSF